MNDLIISGTLGLIMLLFAVFILIVIAWSAAVLIYAAIAAGEYGTVFAILSALLVAGSGYLATGYWLRKKDYI
jgi:hypothetical protein